MTNLRAKIQIFGTFNRLKIVNFGTKLKLNHFPNLFINYDFAQKMDIWHTVDNSSGGQPFKLDFESRFSRKSLKIFCSLLVLKNFWVTFWRTNNEVVNPHILSVAASWSFDWPYCVFKTNLYFLNIFAGDEILSVNGHSTQGLSHSEAIAIFKGIRSGKVTIHVARRDTTGNQTK